MYFKKYYLIVLILLIPIVIAPTINNFTKPNFNLYPNLEFHTKDMQIHDFTNANEITYYYNSLGTILTFSVNNNTVKLEVKEVYYDKQNKEYAIVGITAPSSKPLYENLYVKKPITITLFNEEIQLIARSIIDHDNIEYLSIKGIKEIPIVEEQTPIEIIIEEEPVKIEQPRDKIVIGEPIKKETPKEVRMLLIIFILILTLILVLIFKNNKLSEKFPLKNQR